MRKLTVDFETRSPVDLKSSGVWRYAESPETDVLCLAVAEGDEPPRIWINREIAGFDPIYDDLPGISSDDLGAIVERADILEAHNAEFERAIWKHVFAGRYGLPRIHPGKWRCTASRAAAMALPRSLEGVASALKLPVQKDVGGNRLMKTLCKPVNTIPSEKTQKLRGMVRNSLGRVYRQAPADLKRLFRYCLHDVVTEQAVSRALPELHPVELAVWHLDQTINERGIQVDVGSARAVVEVLQYHEEKLLGEIPGLTNGELASVRQVGELAQHCSLPNVRKDTVEQALERDDLKPEVKRLLEIRTYLGKASTLKFKAVLNRVCSDGRLRGELRYHAASPGRWAGSGVQLQNLPRAGMSPQATETALDLFQGPGEYLDLFYSDLSDTAKRLVRAMLVAGEGRDLIAADFASIEARVLLWLAGDRDGLDLFWSGADIYCDMASDVFDRPVTKADKFERQLGKTMILGLGYGMGAPKFRETCASGGIEIEKKFARFAVRKYREKYSTVPQLWRTMEAGAMLAVSSGGQIPAGPVTFGVRGDFLHCRLPSGRLLSYPYPELKTEPAWIFPTADEDGEAGKIMVVGPSIKMVVPTARKRAADEGVTITGQPIEREKISLTFMSVIKGQWLRETTYGGKLTENVDQAISRDLMAWAMLRLELSGYPIVLTVHDEAVAEVPEGKGSVKEFEELMSEIPIWGKGIPVAAEGWRGKRYRK
jgi:DNA polymerase